MGSIGVIGPFHGSGGGIVCAIGLDVPGCCRSSWTLVHVDHVGDIRRFEHHIWRQDEAGRWLSQNHHLG